MRLILQFGDLYFFIETLSFTLQFFLILITSSARISMAGKVFIFIGLLLLSFLMGNVLTIPLWEFVKFRWLKYHNPCQSWFDVFGVKLKNKTLEIIEIITDVILLIYLVIYAIFCFLGNPIFDIFNMIALLILPCIKQGVLYILYLFRAVQSLFFHTSFLSGKKPIDHDPFVFSMQEEKVEFIIKMFLNCFSGKIQEMKSDNCCQKILVGWAGIKMSKKRLAFLFLKELGCAFSFCYIIWIGAHNKIKAQLLVPIVIWFYNSILAFAIEMPLWIVNYFNKWDCCNQIRANEGINRELRKNPKFKGFRYINSICTFIIPLLIIAYVLFLVSKKDSSFEPITDQTLWNGTVTHFYDQPKQNKKVMSPMCYVGIYHLNIIQIGAIAAASYWNDTKKVQSYLENSFFRDDDLQILDITFPLDKDDHAVLLRVDIDIKSSSRDLTIFAVRGSTTSIDWWLDFEIFISSALISVARWIPVLQSYESKAAKTITSYMTLPLNLLYKATLTYDYTKAMFNVIDKFLEKNKDRTVLFTGHSLGGGLSKVLASKYEFQTVAFSGPGISPIEDKFRPDNYDDYFKSKYIDVIPDNDFVPRFEISGGTKHRVLCEQNGAECHSILRTLCQIGLSCDFEYYTGDFCRGIYSKKEYDDMIKLAHINL